MSKFVHLHIHTEYSLLDGLSKINKLVKKTKELGQEALAITDHGVMYGAIEFYKACVAEEIKPIIGCEMYLAPRSYKDKQGKVDTEPFHLTVLAKNLTGYQNLMKLVSISHLEGYYYRPRVDKKLLGYYCEGLTALSGCRSGEFIRSLEKEDLKASEQILRSYQEIFKDDFYLEMQSHPYQQFLLQATEEQVKTDLKRLQTLQQLLLKVAKQLANRLGMAMVATNDAHYIDEADAQLQDALLCIQTGRFVSEVNRLRMVDTPDYYLKSCAEMEAAFATLSEAVENSTKVAKKVNLELDLGRSYLPAFTVPDKRSADEYLKELTYQGATKKFGHNLPPEVEERLEYELDIITHKQFSNYFLIVADFIQWAHTQGIITNTRGSAAGSLVLYSLEVTNLNPLDYLLPFERFLTKFRPTLPDIDVDMADDRRDEVIRYVMDKYGHDKVAHIVTFGTMMGRAAVRDVGRVLEMSYSEVDRIAKLIPPPHQGFHKPLKDAIKEVPELSDMYRNDPQVKNLLDMAIKLEGTVRHASVHAAGVVIAPEDITRFTPLQLEGSGDKIVSQYDMFSITDEYGGAGLVKMDFLGIRNLSILGRAVEYVKKERGLEVNLSSIPLDDKKTFALLSKGETMGVFQLSSAGITKNLVDLKPTRIQDLSAMVALYRPGPMGIIPEYIKRKNNPKLISYYDPRMKQYLEQSLGLLVYQDDVLLTAINIAGYSWQEADKFRKAMGKKIPAEMAKQKERFIEGCIQNGMSKVKAEGLFELIAPFAAYGFNKAHAASYAMVAYQTAYMKANFPVEFMAAVMTAEYGDSEKVALAIEECKKLGIVVLPPDINKSVVGFSIEDLTKLSREELLRQITDPSNTRIHNQGIRFGLSAIKNVGVGAIEVILKSRNKQGSFFSLADLCSQVDTRLVNRKTLESLIKAGALDTLGSRAAQLLIVDQCLEKAHKASKIGFIGQVSLFQDVEEMGGGFEVKLPDVEELSLDQLLIFEKELLGFYLHEPPFAKKLTLVTDYVSHTLSELNEELVGIKVKIGGVITQVKKVVTKKSGAEMAFLTISDGLNLLEVVIFPKLFVQKKMILNRDSVVLIDGKVDKKEEQLSILVDDIFEFDPDTAGTIEKSLEINVPVGADVQLLKKINSTLRDYPGSVKVSLLLPNGDKVVKRMQLPFGVKVDELLITQVESLLGKGSVLYR